MSDNKEKLQIHIVECGSIRHPGKGLKQRLSGERLPVNCFLIQDQGRSVLVDTGCDSSVVQRLQEQGVAPSDIDVVVISCFDADHTGGLKALMEKALVEKPLVEKTLVEKASPEKALGEKALMGKASPRVLFSDEELYWMQRNTFKSKQPYSNIEGVQHERYFFKACIDGPLHYKFDVFGDESVQLYLCTGHTFGTTACVVTNKATGDYAVLASDIILNAASFEEGEVYHRSHQRKSVKWLEEMAADPKCVAVLPTHQQYGSDRIVEI